jgi:hypothetical protein
LGGDAIRFPQSLVKEELTARSFGVESGPIATVVLKIAAAPSGICLIGVHGRAVA